MSKTALLIIDLFNDFDFEDGDMLRKHTEAIVEPILERELLATYLFHKLKWELLGKTVLLPATVMDQARRAVPALKDCQSANINRLRLALMSRS